LRRENRDVRIANLARTISGIVVYFDRILRDRGGMMNRHANGIAALGLAVVLALAALAGPVRAAVIDFENGTDGVVIRSSIPGLEFTTTDGWDWVYGDWRTGDYNGPYPNGPDPFAEQYYSDGNFFAWLGINQGRGVITFTWAYATYVSIGYSSQSVLYLEAYDENNTLLDTASGGSNLDTGRMNYLRVDAPGMAYVIVHDTGNYWLIDNLDTDALVECTQDIDCDDGSYCSGVESCEDYHCVHATGPIECPDDGIFCNGTEFCSEQIPGCEHTGDPCGDDGIFCNGTEFCSEEIMGCDHTGNPCADDRTCDEETQSCLSPEDSVEEHDYSVGGCGGC
jgi:hypothetical protein